MRKIIIAIHTSLDGFVAGPNGEMDWIKIDDELFDFVGEFTAEADAAMYGRKTYEIMEPYWPTAGDSPDAGKHEKEHSAWYNRVNKYVISNSMKGDKDKTHFIGGNVAEQVQKLKGQSGKNIQIFGSPAASHELMKHNLIDEFWLFVNPILLGVGLRAFDKIQSRTMLSHEATKKFKCGVVALHYKLSL